MTWVMVCLDRAQVGVQLEVQVEVLEVVEVVEVGKTVVGTDLSPPRALTGTVKVLR